MQYVLDRDTENNNVNNEKQYYLTIYGTIPESGPMVAFRRAGRTRSYGRKLVKCPYCSNKITDTNSNTKVEVVTASVHTPVKYTLYLSCNSCNRDVGVKIIIPVY